jgi:hypothetical protein
VRTTTSRWCVLPFNYFRVVCTPVRLLPYGRLWDYTAFILSASTLKIDYFELSTIQNGTAGVSDTSPASGYNLELSRLFVVFFLLLHKLSANTNNPYEAIILLNNIMICLVTLGIKIYLKMTKILTSFTCKY